MQEELKFSFFHFFILVTWVIQMTYCYLFKLVDEWTVLLKFLIFVCFIIYVKISVWCDNFFKTIKERGKTWTLSKMVIWFVALQYNGNLKSNWNCEIHYSWWAIGLSPVIIKEIWKSSIYTWTSNIQLEHMVIMRKEASSNYRVIGIGSIGESRGKTECITIMHKEESSKTC